MVLYAKYDPIRVGAHTENCSAMVGFQSLLAMTVIDCLVNVGMNIGVLH